MKRPPGHMNDGIGLDAKMVFPRNPNSINGRVEAYLQQHGPATKTQASEALGLSLVQVQRALSSLMHLSRAHVFDDRDKAFVFAAGLRANTQANTAPVTPSRQHHTSGDYVPEAWGASIARPGGDQHLGIPSRRGDQRVMHRPPIAMSVGYLADRTSNAK